jgi:hypothetical protein
LKFLDILGRREYKVVGAWMRRIIDMF